MMSAIMLLISVVSYLVVLGFAYALCRAARRGDRYTERLDDRTLALLLTQTASVSDEAAHAMLSDADLVTTRGSPAA